jgi:hypothetical protein
MVTDKILQIRWCDPHRPPAAVFATELDHSQGFVLIIRRTVFSDTFKIFAASETVYSGSSFLTDSSLMPVYFRFRCSRCVPDYRI